MQFLKTWRSEQLGKIRHELKRLHSIENYMGKVDTDNFEPFLDARQVNQLLGSDGGKQRTQEDTKKGKSDD